MRLDKYLQLSRILKQRSTAKEVCEAGNVRIISENGDERPLKASSDVFEGTVLRIEAFNRVKLIRVTEIPLTKNVSKQRASSLYELISEEIVES
ncbi:MAG TPA: RNA-binding S4 domain-containing protein [Firmicutes bacterium]|nr:RNA-binding S4 domain-containing protein [Bacillota bacterium]